MDLSLAAWPYGGGAEQQMDLSLMHPYAGQYKLMERLMGMPQVKAKYVVILRELAAGCFAKEQLLKDLDAIAKTIAAPLKRNAQARAAGRHNGAGFDPPPGMGHAPERSADVHREAHRVGGGDLAGQHEGYTPGGGF